MVLALFFAACSSSEPQKPAEPAKPAAEARKPAAPPPAAAGNEVVVKGSDSEVNLVQKMAEDFNKAHPDVKISVTGGGSGAGIAALLDGTTTLANASRDLKPEEKAQAVTKNVTPMAFVFATDAVAVVVNAQNKVNDLDVTALAGIFQGTTKSWKAVGGDDKPFSLYGRQSSSGTYDYFKKTAVNGEYSADMKQLNGNAEIVEAVSKDPQGIGYVAAGYVKGKPGVKPLGLKVNGQTLSSQDEAQVLSGTYPLARPLFQFMNGKPTGALKDFLAFEASDAGQQIVKDMGFYVIFPDKKAANAALLGG